MPTYVMPEELLAETPSRLVGIPEEDEKTNRIFGCELIALAGIMLRVSQATINTGQILFHRFYYRKSMIDHKVLPVAMTALFLATKVEEEQRGPRDILNVFDRILKRRYLGSSNIDAFNRTSRRYQTWSRDVKKLELVMLKELGYTVYVDHPHRFILFYVKTLVGANRSLTETSQQLAQKAWNYLNDAMRTDVCLRYRPEIIATAAIFLTVRILQINLPTNPPWYRLFGATRLELEEIASIISELYTREKAEYVYVSQTDQKSYIGRLREKGSKLSTETKKDKDEDTRKDSKRKTPSRKERKRSERSRSESSDFSSSSSSYDRRRRRKRRKRSPSYSSASRSRSRTRRDRDRDRDRDRNRGSRHGRGKRGRSPRRDRDRDRDRDKDRGEKDKDKSNQRGREKDKEKESDKKKPRRDKGREHDRDRDRDRDRGRNSGSRKDRR